MNSAGLTRVDGDWVAGSYPAVCAVLTAPELQVPEVPASGAVGTIAWRKDEIKHTDKKK